MNRAALYVEEAVEPVGLLGVHQHIRLVDQVCLFRHYSTHTRRSRSWLDRDKLGMFLPAVYVMPPAGALLFFRGTSLYCDKKKYTVVLYTR